MSYARIRLDNVRRIVYRRAAKIRRCKHCGHDLDNSLNACCVANRRNRR